MFLMTIEMWRSLIALPFIVPLILSCPNGWRQSTLYPDKCYYISVSKKIWFEAESFCMNAPNAPNAHLTSILSAYEVYAINADVIDTPSITSCDQMWIGANDFDQKGQFTWSDGRPFQYKNWDAGQPDLNNQCVSSQTRTTGKWKTEPCGTENCFICESYTSAATTPPVVQMTDCYDWRTIGGSSTDGIYRISPPCIDPFEVWCDMTTDGGGWTVFQRRQDNSVIFWNRTWDEYKNGFNNSLSQNFWLGNDRIHVLSNKDANVTMRHDVFGNRCNASNNCIDRTTWGPCNAANNYCVCAANGYWFGTWDFSIENEAANYRLHVSTLLSGNLTGHGNDDTMPIFSDGAPFETIDRPNDAAGSSRWFCVPWGHMGAWWRVGLNHFGVSYNWCGYIQPNGEYDLDANGYTSFSYMLTHVPCFVIPKVAELKLRKM